MSAKELMIGDKPLSSLRVVDLKEELEKRGLSKSGSKKDLVDRLKNFVQLERQKEEPAMIAADEEQLPNISMQEKLAETNPFIRDYFASQAELFHSQKVAKKLIEEEACRKSNLDSSDEPSTEIEMSVEVEEHLEQKPSDLSKTEIKSSVESNEPSTIKMPVGDDLEQKPSKEEKEVRPRSSASSSPSSSARSRTPSPEPVKSPPPKLSIHSEENNGKVTDDESLDYGEEEKVKTEPAKLCHSQKVEKNLIEEEEASRKSKLGSLDEPSTEIEMSVKEEEDLEQKPSEADFSNTEIKSSLRSNEPSTIKMPVDDDLEQKPFEEEKEERPRSSASSSHSSSAKSRTSPEPVKSPPPKLSTRSEEVTDEEALDYGEEEKVKTDPAKFNWTRRILRLKNTHIPKRHTSKWKRDADGKLSENINTESMMQWFAEVKLVPASDLRLEDKEKSPPSQDVEITRKFSIDSEEGLPIKMENITVTRKVSLIPMIPVQSNEDVDKDVSPSRNPPSELIILTNLVRPFTLPQLKELLQRTGTLDELWVDKIKSKCIAKYEKPEEAFETRAALHGVNWPLSNRKALHVDYTTQEILDEYKARDAGEYKPPVVEKPVTAEILPVREWDVGKRAKSRSPNRQRRRSRSTSRDRKRSRISPSQNRRRHSRSPNLNHDRRMGKEPEPLGKALDELFRKTLATPSIYWLPLTPGQIAEKEELRRKRMLERERRLAEMNKIRPR